MCGKVSGFVTNQAGHRRIAISRVDRIPLLGGLRLLLFALVANNIANGESR